MVMRRLQGAVPVGCVRICQSDQPEESTVTLPKTT